MRILVTGATGYLGRSIVRACQRAGHETLAFSRSAAGAGLPGEAMDGDVRDLERVREAVSGCDAICHSAALVAVWRRRAADFDDVNVGGLRNVLQAAVAFGIQRIVYTSSFLALPPAGAAAPGCWNDYQRTKVLADRLAAEAVSDGVPVTLLYPGVMFGPGAMTDGNLVGRSIADHLAGRLPGVLGANRTWSFAWVDDVAAAHVAALEQAPPGERFSLGGENLPQMTIFHALHELTDRPLPRRIPASLAVLAAGAYQLRAALTRRPPLLTVGTVEILQRDWPMDSSRAIRELGYHVTPLREGVRRIVETIVGPTSRRSEDGTPRG